MEAFGGAFCRALVEIEEQLPQLIQRLKSTDNFPAEESRFVRLMSASADLVLDTEATVTRPFSR